MIKGKLLAVGADPELFLIDQAGKPFSAEGLFGGTKYDPKPMEGLPDGFCIQEDNVAGEFNIPPCSTAATFSKALKDGIHYIEKIARKKKLSVAYASALHFPIEQLQTLHAQTLGCEPDFNAWALEVNPRPEPPLTLRTAAGHVHVSWENPTDEDRIALVRTLDLYLGVPSILATVKDERRSLYGKAGCCRPKEYGTEYRTLGNFWLEHDPNRQYVFHGVSQAFADLRKKGKDYYTEIEDFGQEIQACINLHNKDKAIFLMKTFGIRPFPK